MELYRIEADSLRNVIQLFRCLVDENADLHATISHRRSNLFRVENTNASFTPCVEIEADGICACINGDERISRIRDTTDFDAEHVRLVLVVRLSQTLPIMHCRREYLGVKLNRFEPARVQATRRPCRWWRISVLGSFPSHEFPPSFKEFA